MAVGRISGPLLKSNLIRNGIDLAFETDLLYLDVNNQRIGVKNSAPAYEVDVTGTTQTTDLIVTNQSTLGDIQVVGNTISTTQPYLNIATFDTVVSLNRLKVDSINIEGNAISTNNDDSSADVNLELRPNGTGSVDVHSDMNVTGDIYASGNITADGNINIGDANTDNVIFNAEVASAIIPDLNNTYDLGSNPDTSGKEWANVYVNNLESSAINTVDLTVQGIDLTQRYGNIYYVAQNGNDANTGTHLLDPVATIKYALSLATAGDTVFIYPGDYTEIFPLTIPQGVTLKGESIRSVIVRPTTQTRYNDAVLLNGESTVEDLTLTGFQSGGNFYSRTYTDSTNPFFIVQAGTAPFAHTYVSGGTVTADGTTYNVTAGTTYNEATGFLTVYHDGPNNWPLANPFISGLTFSCSGDTRTFPDNGYAFRYATDYEATSRSPYIRNITVITTGTTVSALDPRGFDAGDAGKGAYIDGAYGTASSVNTALLFHSATFITPGVDAITMTNGARVEWLNSFTYFANRSMFAFDSKGGQRYAGKTKLTLAGITGTFTQGNTLTITSSDASTVLTGTISSVDGNDVYVSGYLELDGFDLTPQSITDGSATATTISSFDLREFGAEVRLIASASVYGNFGLVGNGPGVIMYAIGQNLAYIGNGKEVTNETESVIQANEIVETNGAKIRYNSVDHKGDFRVGDLFYVNQETGNVTFAVSEFEINTTNGVSFTTGANTTFVDGNKIETGDWRISGNKLETLTQDAEFEAANGIINLKSDVNVEGSLDVTGNVTIGGNITIGDEASDTIQIVAGIDSDIIPKTASTYTLGSASKTWSELFTDKVNVDDIQITDNFITTTVTSSNLELRANGTGKVIVPSNDFEISQGFVVSGTTTLAGTNITGTVTHAGANNQTGDTSVTGNVTVTENLDVTGAAQFEEILVDDNYITTTTTSADLELRANGTGKILVPNNDVEITNNLTVDGTISATNTTATSIISKSFSTDSIIIKDNYIEAADTNANLDLRANGTGVINIPSNNLKVDQDFTISGTSDLQDTTIIGNVTQTGNTTQTGNINLTGNLGITGNVTVSGVSQFENIKIETNYITTTDTNSNLELRATEYGDVLIPSNDVVINNDLTVTGTISVGNVTSLGTITANRFSTGDILIDDNFITTTVSSSDLELRTNGTGSVIIDDFDINGSTITTTGEINLTPGNGIINLNATGAVKLPVGNTTDRPAGVAGHLRYNNQLNRFEGYNGTNWINLKGVEDLDGDTKVTAELTEGANDGIIRFDIQGSTIVTIDDQKLTAPQINVDDIQINGNVIETTSTNTNLSLTANGTGSVTFDNFAFKDNTITNTVTNSITTFENTGNGYVKFDGPYGIVLPSGGTGERPPFAYTETGQMRFNTDDQRVEIWDGTNWVSVAGAGAGITRSDAEEIALSTVLVLG